MTRSEQARCVFRGARWRVGGMQCGGRVAWSARDRKRPRAARKPQNVGPRAGSRSLVGEQGGAPRRGRYAEGARVFPHPRRGLWVGPVDVGGKRQPRDLEPRRGRVRSVERSSHASARAGPRPVRRAEFARVERNGDPAAREARALRRCRAVEKRECGEARHFERVLSLKRGTSMRGFWARVGGAGQRACTLLTWAGHGPLPGRRLEQEKKKVQAAAVVEQEKAGAARGTSSGRFR